MSEAVSELPLSLMMTTSIVFEESLARDTHIQTHTYINGQTNTFASILNFFKQKDQLGIR